MKGYELTKKEFANFFRDIAMLGYGIAFVSHSIEKTFKNEKGEDYLQIVPALAQRPYDIVNKMVDIIGYIRNVKDADTGSTNTYIFLRGDDRFLAGSRFKYIEPKVNFTYDSLVSAIYTAIDKQAAENNEIPTDTPNAFYKPVEDRAYKEVMDEAKDLWLKITNGNEEKALEVLSIVESVFGKKMKISEALPSQVDLLELVITKMKELK